MNFAGSALLENKALSAVHMQPRLDNFLHMPAIVAES